MKIEYTNGGKPHICGEIAVHNTRKDQDSYLCEKCGMAIDPLPYTNTKNK